MIPVSLPRSVRKETRHFQCVTCLGLFRVRHKSDKRSCVECEGLRDDAKRRCSNQIRHAQKKGLLVKPATLKCADCGEQAEMYDHRDYSKPLEVEPVCRRCNMERGPAAMGI